MDAPPGPAELERFRDLILARTAGDGADGPTSDDVTRAAERAGVRAVVLVEGVSDRVALETLAEQKGLDLAADGVVIVPMGGATSILRFLDVLDRERGPAVVGLCDAAEADHLARRLHADGRAPTPDAAGLRRAGFHVCDADLEDELLRALGVAEAERVLDDEGDLESFRTFQRQPYQRPRAPQAQLRRFIGSRGGAKIRYAASLVRRLPLDAVPAPLAGVLDDARAAGTRGGILAG
jgi:Predicted ATP-dependent endonuclease of the OLD family